jgi:hypothetical protein
MDHARKHQATSEAAKPRKLPIEEEILVVSHEKSPS